MIQSLSQHEWQSTTHSSDYWETECKKARDELAQYKRDAERLQAMLDAAFLAHPNLDLDIDAMEETK